MRRFGLLMVAAMIAVAVVAATVQAAPPDKNVEYWIDESDLVDCAGVSLDKESVGWVTYQKDLPGPKTVAVNNFHITRTYTNTDTLDTWTVQDTGHIRWFVVDGEEYVSVSGHSVTAPPDDTLNYGRWVLNLDTGDYSVMGRNFGAVDDAACAALVPARDLSFMPVQWTILLDDPEWGPGIHTIFTIADVRPLIEDEVGDLSGRLVWKKKNTTVDLCYIHVRDVGEGYLHIGDGYQTTEGCGSNPTAMQDAFDELGMPEYACVAVTVAGSTYEYCAPLSVITTE